MQKKSISIANRPLNFYDTPTLAFLHPIGLRASFWDGVIGALSDRYRCHALDLPGHGVNALLEGASTLGEMVEHVQRQLDAMTTGPVVMVGCSLGGMVAQGLSLAMPKRVAGLVLSNTSATLVDAARPALRARGLATLSNSAAMIEETLARWFAPGFAQAHPEVLKLVRSWLTHVAPQVQAQAWNAIADLDYLPRLARLHIPMLIVTGSADSSVSPSAAMELANQLQCASHVVVEGAGHMLPMEEPGQFASLIDEFVAGMR